MIRDDDLTAYLDGEASAERQAEIERALDADPALRERLERIESMDRRVRAAFDTTLERPVPQHLLDAVRAGAAPDNVVKFTPAQSREPQRMKSWVGWAIAAQVTIVIAAAALLNQPSKPVDQYRALGSSRASADGNLLVIFRDDTPERVMRETIRSVDARIVGGPTDTDAYLLAVAPATRDTAMARLRGRKDVVMAAPMTAGDSK